MGQAAQVSGAALQAAAAAVRVATGLGLVVGEPIVLNEGSNVVVHLAPNELVARVATRTAAVRDVRPWFAREVRVVAALTDGGAPALRLPDGVDPGPHTDPVSGAVVTLWGRVPVQGQADAAAAGAALALCHAVLEERAGRLDLPALAPLHEVRVVAERLLEGEARRLADAAAAAAIAACAAAPVRPLHGDAHLRNVVPTAAGPVWIDWEDAHLGPVEWDLATLLASALVWDDRPQLGAARAAVAAHGAPHDPALVDRCVLGRAAQAVVWDAVRRAADPGAPDRTSGALAWIAAHL